MRYAPFAVLFLSLFLASSALAEKPAKQNELPRAVSGLELSPDQFVSPAEASEIRGEPSPCLKGGPACRKGKVTGVPSARSVTMPPKSQTGK